MKNLLFTLSLSLVYSFSLAQNTLSGTVLNDENQAIYFATIVLYQQKDSSIAKTQSTDENGNFKIKNIPDGKYYLQSNMFGLKTADISDLQFPRDNGKNLSIKMQSETTLLNDVEIVAKLPFLEQQSDRLVVNIENNITGLNSSLMDVMKKVPGMIVVNDRLSLAGQPNVTILINGKTTKYMDIQSLLRDMPGDNIKKVEIIHQPGAEFDAEGTGAIINVILKKNSLFGTNGSVNIGVGKGSFWKYNGGVNLSHYQGKVNFNASFGYAKNGWTEKLLITRRVGEDSYAQENIDPNQPNRFRTSFGMDWDVTDRHRTGFNSRFIYNINKATSQNNTDIVLNNSNDYRLETTNNSTSKWNFIAFNPYYTFEIDTTGQKLNMDFNYVRFHRESDQLITPMDVTNDFILSRNRYHQPGNTQIISTQIDYDYPFSKALKLKIGAKYSLAKLDNNFQAETEENNTWVSDPSSNHFLFEEHISAGYSKLSFAQKGWSSTLGLRYENSQSKGTSITIDSTIKRSISQLFPSVSIGRDLSKILGVTFAYSYRIDRPRYSNLNPFVYYLDPFTSDRGNPLLSPSLTHSMKMNLAYEKQPF